MRTVGWGQIIRNTKKKLVEKSRLYPPGGEETLECSN